MGRWVNLQPPQPARTIMQETLKCFEHHLQTHTWLSDISQSTLEPPQQDKPRDGSGGGTEAVQWESTRLSG